MGCAHTSRSSKAGCSRFLSLVKTTDNTTASTMTTKADATAASTRRDLKQRSAFPGISGVLIAVGLGRSLCLVTGTLVVHLLGVGSRSLLLSRTFNLKRRNPGRFRSVK
jgi:hypothetical protein